MEYQPSKLTRRKHDMLFTDSKLGFLAHKLDLCIRLVCKFLAQTKPFLKFQEFSDLIRKQIVTERLLCTPAAYNTYMTSNLSYENLQKRQSVRDQAKDGINRSYNVYQKSLKTLISSLLLIFAYPSKSSSCNSLISVLYQQNRIKSILGMALGKKINNTQEVIFDKEHLMFGNLIGLVEISLNRMLHLINQALSFCHVNELDSSFISLEIHSIIDILFNFDSSITSMDYSHQVTTEAEQHLEDYEKEKQLLICTIMDSNVHLQFFFFKIVNKNGLITHPLFNILFHNITGKRRTFKSFQKTISNNLFGKIRKILAYVLLLQKSMPETLILAEEILNDEKMLPSLLCFTTAATNEFLLDFPLGLLLTYISFLRYDV